MSTALAPARQGIPFRADPNAKERAWRASFIRAATVIVLSKLRKTSAEEIERGFERESRAAVAVMKRSDLPGDSVSRLLLLAPRSTAAQLFPLATTVDLIGVSSFNFQLPTSFAAAGFIAEGEPIPVRQGNFVGLPVGPTRKLALLSALSGELETASGGIAESSISRALEDAVGRGMDAVLLSDDAGSDVAPPGLFFGVAPIAGSADMTTDLAALVGEITSRGIDASSVVFIASAARALIIKLSAGPHFDYRVIASNSMANDAIVAIATAGLIIAGDGADPIIDISKQALLNFADPASQISTPGSPNMVAVPTIAMFQADLIALRCVSRICWSIAEGAIASIEGATW